MNLRALCLGLVVALAGCGDDPPSIRTLTYSPNAAFSGVQTSISGMFIYADQDNDISQWVVELIDPNNQLLQRSPPTPVQNASAGVTGTVTFTLMFTPPMPGIYRFNVWLIDLPGRSSNKLNGLVRVAAP